MALTQKQSQDLQEQFNYLKSTGLSRQDATSQIKSKLQSTALSSWANEFETLKNSFNNGGIVGDPFAADRAANNRAVSNQSTINQANDRAFNDAQVANQKTVNEAEARNAQQQQDIQFRDQRVENDAAVARNAFGQTGNFESSPNISPWSKTPLQIAQEQTANERSQKEAAQAEVDRQKNTNAKAQLDAWVSPSGAGGSFDVSTNYADTPYGKLLKNISEITRKNVEDTNARLDEKWIELSKQLDSRTGSGLSVEQEKQVISPFEQFTNKLKDLNTANVTRSTADKQYIQQQYDTAIQQQTRVNEQTLLNAKRLADITWVGFDSGSIQGINSLVQDNQQRIGSLQGERANMLSKYADADTRLDIEYQDNLVTIQKQAQDAIKSRYADVTAQIAKIETDKGTNTKEWLKELRETAKDYATYADNQYKQAFEQMKFLTDRTFKEKENIRNENKDNLDYRKNFIEWVGKTDISSVDDQTLNALGSQAGLSEAETILLTGIRDKQASDKAIARDKIDKEGKITEYQQAQIDIDRQKLKNGETITPYQQAQIDIDNKRLGIDQAKFGLEQKKEGFGTEEISQTGPDLMRSLASWMVNGKKFFGLYASADPTGENRAREYSNIASTGISADLARVPGTKITEEMIKNASAQTGIDPIAIATILKLDSSYGTKGKGARNNNPWNVGQTDTLDAQGITVKGYPTLQEGVNAVAKNLKKRMDAMQGISSVSQVSNKTTKDFSDGDIAIFNSAKYNPQTDKNKERAKKYDEYQNAVAELSADPNADITELMRSSKWGKSLSEWWNKAYKDIGIVVSQLWGLKTAIEKYNKDKLSDALSPISGLIANNNPYDSKAQDIKARLQAIVPKVARGVFGEVGVLTDQDIANYIQTLPNIKQTADTQDVIQLALLGTVKSSLDNAVRTDQATYDISKLTGNYNSLSSKIKELEWRVIGNSAVTTTANGKTFKDYFSK